MIWIEPANDRWNICAASPLAQAGQEYTSGHTTAQPPPDRGNGYSGACQPTSVFAGILVPFLGVARFLALIDACRIRYVYCTQGVVHDAFVSLFVLFDEPARLCVSRFQVGSHTGLDARKGEYRWSQTGTL